MSRWTEQDLIRFQARMKKGADGAGNGPNLDDLPPSKGLVPKGGSTSKAKREFIFMLRMFCQAQRLLLLEEQRFHEVRKWRFDFVVTGRGRAVAIEYHGIMSEGVNGHTGIQHFVDDCEKYRAAVIAGIPVMPYNARDYKMLYTDLAKIFMR